MLCEPVSNTGQLPVLATSNLGQGQLMLRHVAPDDDIPFIIDLLKRETSQNWDATLLLDSFQESFNYIAHSQASQAFILQLDGVPLFEIEIHEARKHVDLHLGFRAGAGDYFIILLAGGLDRASMHAYSQGLRLCLDYFFSFPEVRNIVVPIYAGLDALKRDELYTMTGIAKFLDRSLPKEPDLYRIGR